MVNYSIRTSYGKFTDNLAHVQLVCTRPFILLPLKKGPGDEAKTCSEISRVAGFQGTVLSQSQALFVTGFEKGPTSHKMLFLALFNQLWAKFFEFIEL